MILKISLHSKRRKPSGVCLGLEENGPQGCRGGLWFFIVIVCWFLVSSWHTITNSNWKIVGAACTFVECSPSTMMFQPCVTKAALSKWQSRTTSGVYRANNPWCQVFVGLLLPTFSPPPPTPPKSWTLSRKDSPLIACHVATKPHLRFLHCTKSWGQPT